MEKTPEVLTGFNANIDVIHGEKIFEMDGEQELPDKVDSIEELKTALKYCKERSENHELDYDNLEIEGGREKIGGQGGIISNFLAKTESEAILYTPFLSKELADLIDEKVLYPVYEDDFYLKSVKDSVNSDKVKKNHIFEFEGDHTGRLILSDTLKGYGPYFPKEIEENLDLIGENIDCYILSGFHNVTGNKEAKIRKSIKQLEKVEKPIHIEYVHKSDEIAQLITEYILPNVESLGVDETEIDLLSSVLDIECEKPLNFGEAFQTCRKILEKTELSRIHLHTYRYHIEVTQDSEKLERNRKSMLYGELAAIQSAEKGRIPDSEDIRGFDMEEKKIKGVKQLKDFGDFHNLENFKHEGVAEIDGFNVVGIPVIIHEDPERTVGMGDIISAGAFSSEQSYES